MEKKDTTGPEHQEQPAAAKAPAAPAAKRRYRYIGAPTLSLELPNLSGSINPYTVTDEKLDKLFRRFPTLDKMFEKI